MYIIASYPGHMGGERRPGIDCLHMCNQSPKNLGIRLRLENVGKINAHTSNILPNSKDNTSCDLKVGRDILGRGDLRRSNNLFGALKLSYSQNFFFTYLNERPFLTQSLTHLSALEASNWTNDNIKQNYQPFQSQVLIAHNTLNSTTRYSLCSL